MRQVIELAPGMSSQLFWQEAQLLRHCNHDRIVPLYGVGIQVSAVRWCPFPSTPSSYPCPLVSPTVCMPKQARNRLLLWPIHRHPILQSNLLLLAMGLMDGGSLKLALSSEERRDGLRWEARCGR